jgi:4-nitrophenyl phosphatase
MTKNGKLIEALILDMDGVLWRDTEPIGDLPSLFKTIADRGFKSVFVTNNATKSIQQYVEKLENFGVEVDQNQIVNSGLATAMFLKEKYPQGGPVYAIGEEGLFETLNSYGFIQSEENPLAVVASLDRQLNYEQLKHATRLIRAGVLFIATNPDPSLPTPEGYIPGTGAILAALEAASGIEPRIIGKPSPAMYQIALESIQVKPENALVVGDQMQTDIAAGIEAGCLTALVLTGVADESTVKNYPYKPTYIASNLSQLIDIL